MYGKRIIPNIIIDELSDAGVSIFESDKKGLGVKAASKHSRGKHILSADPIVYIPVKEKLNVICHQCFVEKEELYKCEDCKFLRFCSEECKNRSWDHFHKYECKLLKQCLPNIPPCTVLLVSRLILLRNYNHKSIEQLSDSFFMSHSASLSPKLKESFTYLALAVKELIEKESIQLDITSIINLITISKTNGFNILNFTMDTLGIGIYSTPSLFNHSCCPNCVVTFNGLKMNITTVKDIEFNEEMTIPYVDIGIPKEQRRKDLQSPFFFDCDCPKCLNNENEDLVSNYKKPLTYDFDEIDEIEGEFEHTQTLYERIENDDKKIEILEETLNEMLKIYPDTHHRVLLLYNQLYDTLIKVNKVEDACHYLRKIINVYEQIYPNYWPIIGIRLYELGKLEYYLGNTEKSDTLLRKSKKMINEMFKNHSALKDLNSLLEEVNDPLYERKENEEIENDI